MGLVQSVTVVVTPAPNYFSYLMVFLGLATAVFLIGGVSFFVYSKFVRNKIGGLK